MQLTQGQTGLAWGWVIVIKREHLIWGDVEIPGVFIEFIICLVGKTLITKSASEFSTPKTPVFTSQNSIVLYFPSEIYLRMQQAI
jgi:hypothetical protein